MVNIVMFGNAGGIEEAIPSREGRNKETLNLNDRGACLPAGRGC